MTRPGDELPDAALRDDLGNFSVGLAERLDRMESGLRQLARQAKELSARAAQAEEEAEVLSRRLDSLEWAVRKAEAS